MAGYAMPHIALEPGRKPVGNVAIDWSHWAVDRLEMLVGMSDGASIDLTGKHPITKAGDVQRAPRAHGVGWGFDGAGDYLNCGAMGNFGSQLDAHTTTVLVNLVVDASGSCVVFGTGNSGGNDTVFQATLNRNGVTGTNNTGWIFCRIRDEGNRSRAFQFESNSGISDGKPHTLLIEYSPNASGEIWLDGVKLSLIQQRTDNVSSTANFNGSLDIGSLNWKGTHGVDGYFNGNMSIFCIFSGSFGDAQKHDLSKNPYQMLIPA